MITCLINRFHQGTSRIPFTAMASMINRQMSTTKSYMIVGLGNFDIPNTRHSVGMRAANQLAESLGTHWVRQRTFQSFIATTTIAEYQLQLVLVKPKTPMNINGKSIHKAAQHYGIEPSNIYLLHDELDKPVGVTKIKNGGSARGHNGVRSAIATLKSDVMPRLLIGIDRPAQKSQVRHYVLETFNSDELPAVNRSICDGLEKLLLHIQGQASIEGDLVSAIRKTENTVSDKTTTAS